MSIWLRLCVLLPGIVILSLMMRPFPTHAQCRVEALTQTRDAFVKHLSKTCTDDERRTHAVRADELLLAIQQGQAVDLVGVVIVGDLFLDQLPLRNVVPLSEQLPAWTEGLLASRGVKNVRVISQPVSVRDSRVNGVIATKLKEGYLLIRGSVTMTGTTFAGMVDLSRAIFSEDVNFSDAIFQREGFFLQTVFNSPARFERAVFGVHTRFHRAQFGETVTFEGAQFNGLAEFLEVAFDKDANLSRSSFKMGTGFSGAQFAGHVDFSDAEFQGMNDFSHVSFTVDPVFQRTKLAGSFPTRESLYNFKAMYGIAVTFLVLTLLLIWIRRH